MIDSKKKVKTFQYVSVWYDFGGNENSTWIGDYNSSK